MKSARLSIFGMVSRDNVYHGVTSRQSIKAENVAEFIDNFSLTITKPTFIVLDNASVHTGGLMKESIDKWRARGLFIFYLPPSILATPEYSRDSVENTQDQMD